MGERYLRMINTIPTEQILLKHIMSTGPIRLIHPGSNRVLCLQLLWDGQQPRCLYSTLL